MEKEVICINEERNVTLTAYIQKNGGEFANISKRPAMLVLPGGGYQMCSDREADPVAFVYLKAGYQVFILRYSVKEDAKWPTPLEDYEAAMELIQNKSEEWGLYPDKVAVIGFSAGGHLAAAAAVMAKNRPAAVILGYPVVNSDVKGCNPSAPSLIDKVDEKTCPCFLFASRTDDVVPVANSLEFMQALEKKGISFECHIYAFGPHGFSTCDSSVQQNTAAVCSRIPHWVPDSIGWLKDVLGDFGDGEMTKPVCGVDKDYNFYGSKEAAQVIAVNRTYAGITTPLDLYDALSGIWCAGTCAPRMRDEWSPENKTLGQCSITAFLAQDIFGGEVYGIPLKSGGVHCYNVVNGITFDLTSEQFGEEAKNLVYSGNEIQERETPGHFGKEEKRQRYEFLKKALVGRKA